MATAVNSTDSSRDSSGSSSDDSRDGSSDDGSDSSSDGSNDGSSSDGSSNSFFVASWRIRGINRIRTEQMQEEPKSFFQKLI